MTATLDAAAVNLTLFAGPEPTGYDASVASDGLTIDTDFGPVDLIVIKRALEHRSVELSYAEVRYLARLRRNGVGRAA